MFCMPLRLDLYQHELAVGPLPRVLERTGGRQGAVSGWGRRAWCFTPKVCYLRPRQANVPIYDICGVSTTTAVCFGHS